MSHSSQSYGFSRIDKKCELYSGQDDLANELVLYMEVSVLMMMEEPD